MILGESFPCWAKCGYREGPGFIIEGSDDESDDSDESYEHSSESDISVFGEFDDSNVLDEMDLPEKELPQVCVQFAGCPAVNGVYTKDGHFNDVPKYIRHGQHKDEKCTFCIFKRNDNICMRWYISIVPSNGEPGTSADIDLYSNPSVFFIGIPPFSSGIADKGTYMHPPPTLTVVET